MNKKLFQQYDLNYRPPTEQKMGYITQKNETFKLSEGMLPVLNF